MFLQAFACTFYPCCNTCHHSFSSAFGLFRWPGIIEDDPDYEGFFYKEQKNNKTVVSSKTLVILRSYVINFYPGSLFSSQVELLLMRGSCVGGPNTFNCPFRHGRR